MTSNQRMGRFVDITGQKFGSLTATSFRERKNGKTIWNMTCDCGRHHATSLSHLRCGSSVQCKTCRTKKASLTRKRNNPNDKLRSEFNIWRGMNNRCSDLGDKNYGGRGIRVNYSSFSDFIDDIGPRPSARHSVDRIDNNKGYEKGNCRWATSKEQNLNRRNNRIIEIDGNSKPISEWADQYGVCRSLVNARIKRLGWSEEDAVKTPAGKSPSKKWSNGPTAKSTTGMKGVYWRKQSNRWISKLITNDGRIFCRSHMSKEAAGKSYDLMAIEHSGVSIDNLYLNFPELHESKK